MVLLVALVAAGVLWWRIERIMAARHAAETKLREQELALAAEKLAVDRQAFAIDDATAEMPVDLAEWCLSESETWAQEDNKRIIRELAQSHHGDWDKVRAQLGPLMRLGINERGVLPS